jgi:hypothetical protein
MRLKDTTGLRDAVSAKPKNWLAVCIEFSAKQFFAERPLASTGLSPRAAETDREVASLLSVHPRSADVAILLFHLQKYRFLESLQEQDCGDRLAW